MSNSSQEGLGGVGQLWRYLNDVNLQLVALLNQDDRNSDVDAHKCNQCEGAAEYQLATSKQTVLQKSDQTVPEYKVTQALETNTTLDTAHGKIDPARQISGSFEPPQSYQMPTQQVEQPPSHHYLYSQYFQHHDNHEYQNETALHYQRQQLLHANPTPETDAQGQVAFDCAYCAWLARVSQQSHQIQASYSDC